MKKRNLLFFLKLIFALLPLIAIVLYTGLFPFGYMDSEYPSWKYSKEVSMGQINPYDADGPTAFIGNIQHGTCVILGDSRAMADLVPNNFNEVKAVNLAIGGGTSIEMYYTLKNYIENVGVPEQAIVMFAPFHYSIIDNFNERTLYFNYLSITELYDLYKAAEAVNSETLVKPNYGEEIINAKLRTPMKYLPALINAKGITRYNTNKEIFNRMVIQKGHDQFGTLDGCSDLNYETTYEKMHTTGDAVLLDTYFNKLLSLLRENNIKTTVSIPPMNQSSYTSLHDSYKLDFEEYLQYYTYKYPEILIETEIPAMDDEYFGDASHLNKRGAEAFTQEYAEAHGL